MTSLKVIRHYAGHGIARTMHIPVPGKPGYVYKHDYVGSLWTLKTWITAGEQFSRGDGVIRIGRVLYRLTLHTAKPLVMRPDEHFRSWDWHEGAAFVYDYCPAAAHAQASA